MNIGSVLINFVLDILWFWAFGVPILLLVRMAKRKPLFTENDWLALAACSHGNFFSPFAPAFLSLCSGNSQRACDRLVNCALDRVVAVSIIAARRNNCCARA